jgi:hypothetical protein
MSLRGLKTRFAPFYWLTRFYISGDESKRPYSPQASLLLGLRLGSICGARTFQHSPIRYAQHPAVICSGLGLPPKR